MSNPQRLSRSFFNRNTVDVARELIGNTLIRVEDGRRISGIITETEAYRGEEDLACHARSGRTKRTIVMYGPPGHAYVYFTYGTHWMLNFVTEAEDFPAAVLLRGIQPVEGVDIIGERRKARPQSQWTNGPGKICQALNIDKRFNGMDLCSSKAKIFIEIGNPVSDSNVTIGPRVGLNTVHELWLSIPWRFLYTIDKKQGSF